jgi:hypothetical protein
MHIYFDKIVLCLKKEGIKIEFKRKTALLLDILYQDQNASNCRIRILLIFC